MTFVEGYPVGESIKPALYINDPTQTHDFIQSYVPGNISQWLFSLIDQRHHFYGIRYPESCYIIERYTEEDYKYAYDFSLKLYHFLKYLSSFQYLVSPQSDIGKQSGLNFGGWFEDLQSIDSSLYNRDYDDILTLNLPSSENEDSWLTITFYETVPWLTQEYWRYLSPQHAVAVGRETTLLTKNDIAIFEIPDSRNSQGSSGSRIALPVESPDHDHYIKIEYNYPFQAYSTENCLIDPISRRYNLSNNKYQVRGQEINLNLRWFVGYTMVLDSNDPAIIDQVKSQIPEHYLYENFSGYLELLLLEIEDQHQSKKIPISFSQKINFSEELELFSEWKAVFNSQLNGYTTRSFGDQSVTMKYLPEESSYDFTDINPEVHYFANLLYANNNLYKNSYGDTSTFSDLGIGVHIKVLSGRGFYLDNGETYHRSINQTGGGIYLDVNGLYEVVTTGGGQREGMKASADFDKRNDYKIYAIEKTAGVMEFSDDEAVTYLRCFNAYRFFDSVAPFMNSFLYSEAEIPSLVFGDVAVELDRDENYQEFLRHEDVIVYIKHRYSLDDDIFSDLSEYTGELNFTNTHKFWGRTEDSEHTFFFGLESDKYSSPYGVVRRNASVPNLSPENPPVTFSLNHSFDHSWEVTAQATPRNSPQLRDFSYNLAKEEENINAFNHLFFEECSCMTAQVAQEILDLVREIHASLDAGKYAYQKDGETKRVANIGYYTERIARVLGISVSPDGSIRSIRQAKLIESGDSIPAGWNLGQFGRNQGGSSVGQTGGSSHEDRDGLAYAVRSNSFGTDPFTGEANLIKEGGYVLVENIPQLLHLMLDDLDRAFGLQNAGANVIPSPNGELIPIQGINNILLELLYTLGQTNKSASKTHISSLITQAIAKEILQALGVPLTIKKLPVKVDSENQGYIPIPGTTNRSPSLVDLQFLSLINIASILEGKIDFKTEDLEKEKES